MKQIIKRVDSTTMDAVEAFEMAYRALVNSKKVGITDAFIDDRVFIEKSRNALSLEIRLSNDARVSIVLDQIKLEAKIIVCLSGKKNQKTHRDILNLAEKIEWYFIEIGSAVYDYD